MGLCQTFAFSVKEAVYFCGEPPGGDPAWYPINQGSRALLPRPAETFLVTSWPGCRTLLPFSTPTAVYHMTPITGVVR